VGREEEVREIAARLTAGRLVSLTGPGGVGKTRLAIEVAHALADDHVNGVWFVDLSRLFDPALVPQAVASTLGVPEQPDQLLTETLAEDLRSRQLLLGLDNCEHLLSACAELVDGLLSRPRAAGPGHQPAVPGGGGGSRLAVRRPGSPSRRELGIRSWELGPTGSDRL